MEIRTISADPITSYSVRAVWFADIQGEGLITSAMVSGLTDHIWSIQELLSYNLALLLPLPLSSQADEDDLRSQQNHR